MRITILVLALVSAFALTASVASAVKPNPGTIKVHDNEVADPEERNEPHVSCDFWVEGTNMQLDSGTLVFEEKPPTGTAGVTPTGDGLDWSADSGNSQGNFHFLNGPYQLPEGHYKVTSQDGEEKEKSKVFWVDACCESDCEPPPCEETQSCAPLCPDNVTAEPLPNGSIRLTWDASTGAVSYDIFREDGAPETNIASTDDTTYIDDTTTAGVTYKYRIVAVGDKDSSEGCPVIETTAIPFFPSAAGFGIAAAGGIVAYAMLRRKQ